MDGGDASRLDSTDAIEHDAVLELVDDPVTSALLTDLVVHPNGLVSHKEFSLLHPDVSGSELSKQLRLLRDHHVINRVPSPYPRQGNPRFYYYLTPAARAVFDAAGRFQPGALPDFPDVEADSELAGALDAPRPTVDVETVDLNP